MRKEYIDDVGAQIEKLDWAFPFQRTGPYPIDRSSLFSSLSDAQKYAKGVTGTNVTDSRELSGSAYVGQIIVVKEGTSYNAYIIIKEGNLLRLATTTSTGDFATDIADLKSQIKALSDKTELFLKEANDYTDSRIPTVSSEDKYIIVSTNSAYIFDFYSYGRKVITDLSVFPLIVSGAVEGYLTDDNFFDTDRVRVTFQIRNEGEGYVSPQPYIVYGPNEEKSIINPNVDIALSDSQSLERITIELAGKESDEALSINNISNGAITLSPLKMDYQLSIIEANLKTLIGTQTTAAMEFKGVAQGLPTGSPNKGDMYKVTGSFTIPAANNAQEAVDVTVKFGDVIVYDDNKQWYVIPSGDDIEDTWRTIKVNGETILGSGTTTESLDFTVGDDEPGQLKINKTLLQLFTLGDGLTNNGKKIDINIAATDESGNPIANNLSLTSEGLVVPKPNISLGIGDMSGWVSMKLSGDGGGFIPINGTTGIKATQVDLTYEDSRQPGLQIELNTDAIFILDGGNAVGEYSAT